MSKTRKLVEQDVQRDEVAEGMQRLLDTLKRNRTSLLALVVVGLLVIIITSVVSGHQERVVSDSNAIMSQALNNYNRIASQTDPKQRKEAVNGVLTSTNNLTESYPGIKLAREALYLRGSAFYSVDDFDKAKTAYTTYLDKATTDEERARGEIALGYTFENQIFLNKPKNQSNQLDQAMEHYRRAVEFAKGGGGDAKPAIPYLYFYALMGQARLFELTNKDAEAIKIYTRILKDRPVPVPVAPKKDKEAEASNPLMDMIREQINTQEAQLSFQATAQLRLERLQATPATPAAPTTTATAPVKK